jgi:7,8-dihydroneopterin aldolase/epimerase/oxygenase
LDKIFVKGMSFYGYHGLYPEENKLGQRYTVSLTIELDLSKAGETDQMEDSIDYGQIYEITKQIVEGEAKNLVEAVAEDIAQALLAQFPKMEAITVHVSKPGAPIPGNFETVAVEIHREKNK